MLAAGDREDRRRRRRLLAEPRLGDGGAGPVGECEQPPLLAGGASEGGGGGEGEVGHFTILSCVSPPSWLMRAVHLRVAATKNNQKAALNWAADFEFDGAVAQLARAFGWQPKGQGFESPQLHSSPTAAIGSDEFRNRLGYYLDLAAEGQELTITRWGKRFLRVTPWQPPLPEAQAALRRSGRGRPT